MKREPQLNLDRLVRSATAGSAGEPYCSLILDSLGIGDFSSWSLDQINSFWMDAERSDLTVAQFIEHKRREVKS
jgi:hypothetical protein|tara:strand:+ start:108 stop:329 length:222 start_codon:yes stop_codon:yes gene_type:complete